MVYAKTKNRKQWVKDLISFTSVVIASFIMALNIRTFVRAGDLFPGGFTGLTVLIQRIGETFFNVTIPYTIVNVTLNAVPAYISLKTIGKRFTIFSVIMIFLTSFFVDFLPSSLAITSDRFLVAVFGGMINGFAIGIALYGRASSGGTDFIAVYLTEKFNLNSWNVVLGINATMLTVAGLLFGWDAALYSIVYQFISTQMIRKVHQNNSRVTLHIITSYPEELQTALLNFTHHGITRFEGIGCYKNEARTMLYTVVAKDEVKDVIKFVRTYDPNAFINVTQSENIYGRFYRDPLN